MEVRDVTLTLPDGETKVVARGVPAGTTFSALRRYVNGLYKLESSFALVVGGTARHDDDVIDADCVSVVYTEGSPDRVQQFTFVLSQAVAAVLIGGGRRNWEVLAAAAVGLAVFAVAALLSGRRRSGRLGRVQFEYRRFMSLFFRSMNPSFRLEHLRGRQGEAGNAE
jgi:hypothetical protein